MADHILFIGWHRPISGRENQAIGCFEKWLGFWNKAKSENKIESFEPFFLTPHGGDMNGFMLVRGEQKNLNELVSLDEFGALTNETQFSVSGFGVISGVCGAELTKYLGQWKALSSK